MSLSNQYSSIGFTLLRRMLSSSSSTITTSSHITYNDQQQIILALLPIVSGLLSAIGSAGILYLILRGPDSAHTHRRLGKNSSTNGSSSSKLSYERIMIGMSSIDIINSLRASTTTFLMPRDTPGVWEAYGTQGTCSIQGFFAQLGFGVSLYSASLAIYFLLSINPSIHDITLTTKYEPFLHGIPIVFATITAILGLVLDSYNPVPLGIGCWVAAYPYGCVTQNVDGEDDYSACTRGHNAGFLLWVFGGIPIIVSYIIIIACMGGIYYSVWKQIRKMEIRYSTTSQNITRGISTSTSSSSLDGSGITTSVGSSVNAAGSSSTISTSLPARSRGTNQRLQRVRNQAFLYIAIFFVTYIWPSINRIVESHNTDTTVSNAYFIVSMFSQIFYPLQGFFNFFIYIRPRYFELKKQFSTITVRDIAKLIFGYVTINDYTTNLKKNMTASTTSAMLNRPHYLNNNSMVPSSNTSGQETTATTTTTTILMNDVGGTRSLRNINASLTIPSFSSQHKCLAKICDSTRHLNVEDGIMMVDIDDYNNDNDDNNNNNNDDNHNNNNGDKSFAVSAGTASTLEVFEDDEDDEFRDEEGDDDCKAGDTIKELSNNNDDETSKSSISKDDINN